MLFCYFDALYFNERYTVRTLCLCMCFVLCFLTSCKENTCCKSARWQNAPPSSHKYSYCTNTDELLKSFNCSLHFAWVIDDAKYIVVTRVCVCVSVCVSVAVRPHYCMDPDVTWGRGRGCPLVVHYWADLQLAHGLRCCGNITRNDMIW